MRKQLCRRGFSLIELLIAISIIRIMAAIAVPLANKQLMLTRENAAVRQIQTIHQAETQYLSQYGRYAQALSELGPPATGADGQAAANLIPGSLAGEKHSGFVFSLTGTPVGYSVTAVPEVFGGTGGRTFYSDQTLLIHQNTTVEVANANSAEIR